MLNLRIAECFVDLSVQMSRYNRDMSKVRKDLGNLPGSIVIDLSIRQTGLATILRQINALRASAATPIRLNVLVDRTRAVADLNLLRQQAQALVGGRAGRIGIRADLRQWNRAMVMVFTDLHRIRTLANIPVRANTTAAHSSVNLLIQQLQAAQTAARGVVVPRGLGGYGGAGGGVWGDGAWGAGGRRGAAGSFVSGMAMGSGLGYTSNPYMLAGDVAARTAVAIGSTGIDLESRYEKLRGIANLTTEQIQDLKRSLADLATTGAQTASLQDLVGFATMGARAGVGEKEGVGGLKRFTAAMSSLRAIMDDMDAENMSDQVLRALNAFHLGTDYAKGFGSAIAELDNRTVASAADILNMTQRMAGFAHAAELSIEETLALSAAIRETGTSPEVGATAISQILQKMGTEKERFAKALNISSDKWAEAYKKGPLTALELLLRKVNELDSASEKMEFLDELHFKGVRVAGTFLKLANNMDKVKELAGIAHGEFATGAAADRRQAIKGATSESHLTRAGSALSNAASTLYENTMKGTVDMAADAITDASQVFAEGIKRWVAALEGNPLPPIGTTTKQALPPPPGKAVHVAKTLDEATEVKDKAAEEMKAAWRELHAARERPGALREEANQMMTKAVGNPAMEAAAMKKLGEVEVAEKAVRPAEERAKKAEEAFDAALAQQQKLQADDDKAKQKQANANIADNFVNKLKTIAGTAIGAKRDLKQSVLPDAIAAAVLKTAKAPDLSSHASVTMNSAFERGVRIQEAILNRSDEKGMTKQQEQIAENTREAKDKLTKVHDTLTAMLKAMGGAVLGE